MGNRIKEDGHTRALALSVCLLDGPCLDNGSNEANLQGLPIVLNDPAVYTRVYISGVTGRARPVASSRS